MGLFGTSLERERPEERGPRPLADRMRPQTLDEFIGQEALLGSGKPLPVQIERDELSSIDGSFKIGVDRRRKTT